MRLSSGCSGRRSEPSTCAAFTSATGSACIGRSLSAGRCRRPSWRERPGSRSATRSNGLSSRPPAQSSMRSKRRTMCSGSRFRPGTPRHYLTNEESLNYVSPFGRLLVACLRPIHALLDAYRNGGGVPYADYGADLHEGQAAFTRPLFSRLLAQEWLLVCRATIRRSGSKTRASGNGRAAAQRCSSTVPRSSSSRPVSTSSMEWQTWTSSSTWART